jgi:hypothetical protein
MVKSGTYDVRVVDCVDKWVVVGHVGDVCAEWVTSLGTFSEHSVNIWGTDIQGTFRNNVRKHLGILFRELLPVFIKLPKGVK